MWSIIRGSEAECSTNIESATREIKTGCGPMHVTITTQDDSVIGIWATLGKSGGCPAANLYIICKLINKLLAKGERVESIMEEFKGVSCPNPTYTNGERVLSCIDAMAIAVDSMMIT